MSAVSCLISLLAAYSFLYLGSLELFIAFSISCLLFGTSGVISALSFKKENKK